MDSIIDELHCKLSPVLHQRYEYIPSLNDIRSQRSLKVQLDAINKAEKRKQDQAKEDRMKQEKISLKEKEREKRKRQRLEVRTLDKRIKRPVLISGIISLATVIYM